MSLIVERAVEIAEGKASSQIALVVGEPGGGKTRVIRDVFEGLCELFDSKGRYTDVLPGRSLIADRDDNPVPMPFWWWPVDFANEETLHALAGVEIAQRRADTNEHIDSVQFVRAAANWVPIVGQSLSIATLVFAACENLKVYTSRTSHSVESIVERLVTDLVRLAADRLVVVVIDDAELANAKTAPLIEALVATEGARVLVLAAGDPFAMSEQAVNYGDEQTVASMCRRHHATSHPLAPLNGRELAELALTTGGDLGAAAALDATGGNPALLAAYIGRGPGDPLIPEDVSRNRYWAELARRWPTPGNQPTNGIFAVLASNSRPAYGLRSAAEAGGAIAASDVIALLDPGIRSGILVATRPDCLEWRCPAFARFASRFDTATSSVTGVAGRDHEPGRVSEIVAQTVGLAGLLVNGATGYGPLTARWHAAKGLIETASPTSTHESLRLAHGEAILTAHIHPHSTIAQAQALWVTARAALKLHEWTAAVHLLETAVTLYEQTGPVPEWLMEEHGATSHRGGHYRNAAVTREKLAERKRLRLGNEHPDTLTALHNFAETLTAAGRLHEAIAVENKVLKACVRILGDKHRDTSSARNVLALAYNAARRPHEAIALQEQLLNDYVDTLGNNHLYTITARHNLALTYLDVGRLQEALALQELVLTARVEVLGDKHERTLTARNSLATSYRRAGQFDRAISLQESVLADRIEALGERHPSTLITRNNLAVSYQSAGRLGEAIIILRQVVADRSNALGDRHPRTLRSKTLLGNCYQEAGDTAAAIVILEQVCSDCHEVLGDKHPDTLNARAFLARSNALPGHRR